MNLDTINPRSIAAPCVRDAIGRTFTGSYHGDAIDRANMLGAAKIPDYSAPCWDVPYEVGFVTWDDEFLTREQAFIRACELKQLTSEDETEDFLHTRTLKNVGAL